MAYILYWLQLEKSNNAKSWLSYVKILYIIHTKISKYFLIFFFLWDCPLKIYKWSWGGWVDTFFECFTWWLSPYTCVKQRRKAWIMKWGMAGIPGWCWWGCPPAGLHSLSASLSVCSLHLLTTVPELWFRWLLLWKHHQLCCRHRVNLG